MTSHFTPQRTRLLTATDLEKEEMKIKLKHPSIQTLPSGSKFQDLYVSLDLTSILLVDKVNLHRKVGEMLYNDMNRNQMTIDRAQDYIDNLVDNVKVEKVKSRALFQ